MNGNGKEMQKGNISYWSDTGSFESFESLQENGQTEVAVIGAGMVGIISAWILAKRGRKVTLVEAEQAADGVSAYTTGKITSQHLLIYQEIKKFLGKKKARQYYEANEEGLLLIESLINDLNLDCDFERKDALVYATTEAGKEKLLKEGKAYQELEIEGYFSSDIPDFPDGLKGAIGITGQAQFHPVKFLQGVLEDFLRLGGKLYEHSRVLRVMEEAKPVLEFATGVTLQADDVIIATHYPINDQNGLYFARLKVNRSYAVLGKPTKRVPLGMYITAENPTRSFRTVKGEDGAEYLLVVGDGHFPGRGSEDKNVHYQNLKDFAKEKFGMEEILYQWSTQDPSTPDKIPYIGKMSSDSDHIFVATGFNKWGMGQGAFAGKLLADLLTGTENRFAKLYDPTRTPLKTISVANLAKDNTLVGKELLTGKVAPDTKDFSQVGIDEGALVKVEGELMGVYRDPDGGMHHVDPTCTHMGCTVNWNDAEKSWDCPCHGSRFDFTGEVLEGPAVKPLKKK